MIRYISVAERVLQRILLPLEQWQVRVASHPRGPQIFILGLPRSGTTLAYQYLAHRLDVAYFTSGANRFPGIPCTITRLQRTINGRYRSDFTSFYGQSRGAMAPHEAGAFWMRYFDPDSYVSESDLAPGGVDRLQRTIGAIEAGFGYRPFINKNVKHLLRIRSLASIFPRAVFVVMEREPEDVALSILRGRGVFNERLEDWWSVRPPDYPRLRSLPVAEQIAGQVVSLQARMKSDFASMDPSRLLRVSYPEFCRNPEGLSDAVADLLNLSNRRNEPVQSFPVLRSEPGSDVEEQLIQELRKQIRISENETWNPSR